MNDIDISGIWDNGFAGFTGEQNSTVVLYSGRHFVQYDVDRSQYF